MSVDNAPHEEVPTEEIELAVNGEAVVAEVEPRLKLSDFLRRELDLRGVRVGCEHGVCGACTVLMDGKAVKSCLLLAVQADGAELTTVEGLTGDGDRLHPIQEAFHETHALQCGFCTSGFVMATKELLDDDPDPDREAIEHGLADNVCRCTGYQNIYDAVDRAADYLADGDERESIDEGSLPDPEDVGDPVEDSPFEFGEIPTEGDGDGDGGGGDVDGVDGDDGDGNDSGSEGGSSSSVSERGTGGDP